MRNNRLLQSGFLLMLICVVLDLNAQEQDYMNTRKVSLFRGDTSLVAEILSDIRIQKVNPGVFYYWYGHEQINANQGGYSGHLLHGEYLEYGPSGKMLLKGTHDKGVRSGRWIYWYKEGAVQETRDYEEGMLEGRILRYSPDGRIIHSAEYRHNVLDGEMTIVVSDTLYKIKYKKGKEKKRRPIHVFDE